MTQIHKQKNCSNEVIEVYFNYRGTKKNLHAENCSANVNDHDDFTPTTEWDLMSQTIFLKTILDAGEIIKLRCQLDAWSKKVH